MVESGRVLGNGKIRPSIKKIVLTNTEKGSNECEYRKMEESGRVWGKGRIRASTKNLSGCVPKKGGICASAGKVHNLGDYRKRVESV